MNKQFSYSLLALAGLSSLSVGQAYIPGNITFVRMGNQTTPTALTPSGINNNLTFFDVAKASTGQNFTRSTSTATTSIAFNGVDPLGGMITRSPNGYWISITGYSAPAADSATDVSISASATNQRRFWQMPAHNGITNTTGTSIWTLGPATLDLTPVRGGVTLNGGQLIVSHDSWTSSTGLYFPVNSGPGSAGAILDTAGVRHIMVSGGFLFFSTATGIFRATIPTTGGLLTPVQIATGTNLNAFEFLNNQALIAADLTDGIRRFTLTGADTWATISSPVTGEAMDSTANRAVTGITTDGINVIATNLPGTASTGNNNTLAMRYVSSGTVTPTSTRTAGTNFVYRGITLSPEPSIVNSAPTGTSGEVRFVTRTQGTASDPFTRSAKISTVNFSDGRAATVNATIPMKGHFADMTVDRNGNTLILCISPNATQNGWVYSVIRVSADGTLTDEGPVTNGVPSQAAPSGFLPVSIRASSQTDEASVLMWNPTANSARLGIVTLPASIGSGVTTVADWGPYTATLATVGTAMRAVAVAYSRVGNQPHILWSRYGVLTATGTAGEGIWELRAATNSSTSTQFATQSGVALLRAIGVAFDDNDKARILQSGGHNWFISSSAYTTTPNVNTPQRFRVDTWSQGGTSADTVGTQYLRDSTVTNSVTSAAIFAQMMPSSIHWDAAAGRSTLNQIQLNGSQIPTVLAGDQRLNIPGSFRAWQMDGTTNNAAASTYRFFPGINL